MEAVPNRKYVELFAGCGGMSLGLESAGFGRLFANEASPMAGETFAYNLVKAARESGQPPTAIDAASWGSHFTFLSEPIRSSGVSLSDREFRDWRNYPENDGVPAEAANAILNGARSNLIVGNATALPKLLAELQRTRKREFQQRYKSIDLLAGGPPCQSFSLAGKRQRDHPRNRLFLAFVEVAKVLNPQVVLFENVLGITRPFKDENGEEWHPWHEVCRAFRQAGFVPIPALVNAADFGVPQSRLRFIMVALAKPLADRLLSAPSTPKPLAQALKLCSTAFAGDRQWEEGDDRRLIFRLETAGDLERWPEPLFPRPTHLGKHVGVEKAIGDISWVDEGECFAAGEYSKMLTRSLPSPEWVRKQGGIANHATRIHAARTKARFRVIRALAEAGLKAKNMTEVIRARDTAIRLLSRHRLYLVRPDGSFTEEVKFATSKEVGRLLDALASAKQSQRCLDPDCPAPAQLSIPDDFIHWEDDRVLTIREMARIQSFPDWFEFRSKPTTGGDSRAYEVPQYTQVGNAVPPLLAKHLGAAIASFLDGLRQSQVIGRRARPVSPAR